MQNFDYLKDITELRDLYIYCAAAEATQKSDYDSCALNCRRALEWMVKTIYQLKHLAIPERATLLGLMSGEPFTEFIADERLMMAAHWVRKVGNLAAHEGGVKGGQAYFSLLNLYNFIGGVLLKLGVIPSLAPFDRSLIPGEPAIHIRPQEKVTPAPVSFIRSVPEEKIKKPEPVVVPSTGYTEAQTRKLFIDLLLQEAGWKVQEQEGAIVPGTACIEIPVTGMPSESGKGYVDYVLFGADSRPLAIVEAKKTSVSIEAGKQQAKLYADCLEHEYGVRPVIFITNGFHTQIIDDLGYPARDVYGIHNAEDLLLMIQRKDRPGITDMKVREDITDRYYQKEAIHAVCSHFNDRHRRALIVMATGTGKTRVSISVTEILMRNNWAKNILFLADRKALVNQAKKSFSKLLPSVPMTALNEERRPDLNARITFSTYQTMIRYIDREDKPFSVGHFDLIIVDEAHRSIFGKYESILDYFDGLFVGLTATPRESVEKSTYDLFGLEDRHPNYDYDLGKAIKDGYLVPPRWFSCSTAFLKDGIKFNQLTAVQKAELERVWEYENIDPGRDIESPELLSYIFNKDTIDKVLEHLMVYGQKIEGGEKLGKTIIFAANHDHATLIVERFHALYPKLGEDFCVLIDNQVKYGQTIIDRFSTPDKMPQIAVSVDMLDTGIDVPEVVNLVFFKKIRSKIKFWQMVGRGTRLCPNVSGDGEDKKDFYLFDWLGNIEYFAYMAEKEPEPRQSLSSRLFTVKTELVATLQEPVHQDKPGVKEITQNIKDSLAEQVQALGDEQIGVRKNWELVDRFRKQETWNYLSAIDSADLTRFVAPMVNTEVRDIAALKFDLLMYLQMIALVQEGARPATKAQRKVVAIAQALLQKTNIPEVAAKRDLLVALTNIDTLRNADLARLQEIQTQIRDIVHYLAGERQQIFVLNIEDVLNQSQEEEGPQPVASYYQRIMDWLQENRNLPVLQKLRNIEPLTHADIIQLETICWRDLGTREEYQEYVRSCRMICGDQVAIFIRSLFGIDRIKAYQRYSDFLTTTALNPAQEQYLNAIVEYVSRNGDITTNTLVNESSFLPFQWQRVFGPEMVNLGRYVNNFHDVIVA